MPDFSTVKSQVVCPRCGQTSPPRIVYFRWGKVPRDYELADEIEWGSRNFGEPQHLNVLAFDNDSQRGPIHCQKCGEHLTVAAHIQGGKVIGAKTLTAEEARRLSGRDPDKLGIAIINDDGSYTYRDDWK